MLNEGHFADFAPNRLPWQCPFRNQIKRSRSVKFMQISFDEKIVNISTVDPEVILLRLNKEGITEGKIYSKFAKRAKNERFNISRVWLENSHLRPKIGALGLFDPLNGLQYQQKPKSHTLS